MYNSKVKLLTVNNHKTIKSLGYGYTTYILYLAPHVQNSKGINLCPHASAGCAAGCLFKSGMGGVYENVIKGRTNKTEYYLDNRDGFLLQLANEIDAAIKRHGIENIAIRLNGTADIRWEKLKVGRTGLSLFELFPDVIFYDYTKNPHRFDIELPSNYHLTFSRSEENHDIAINLLKRGFNVSMVFSGGLPSSYEGYKVINGDLHDLLFLHEKNVIVGLSYKSSTGLNGKERNKIALASGFVIKN